MGYANLSFPLPWLKMSFLKTEQSYLMNAVQLCDGRHEQTHQLFMKLLDPNHFYRGNVNLVDFNEEDNC